MSEQPNELHQQVPVTSEIHERKEEEVFEPAFVSDAALNHDGEVVKPQPTVAPSIEQPAIEQPVVEQPEVEPVAEPAGKMLTTDSPEAQALVKELGMEQPTAKEEHVSVPPAVRLNIQQEEEPVKDEVSELDALLVDVPTIAPVQSAEVEAPKETKATDEKKDPLASIHQRLEKLEASTEIWKYNVEGTDVKPSSAPVSYPPGTYPYRNVRKLDTEDKGFQREVENIIMLPSGRREAMMDFMERNPDQFDGPDSDAKLVGMTSGFYLSEQPRHFQDEAIADPNNKLALGYEVQPGKFQRSRRMSTQPREGKASGVVARALIMDAVGMATPFQVVLPHSGLVVLISTPTAAELLNFQSIIDNSKVRIGRALGGSNYGQQTWFLHSQIVDLFLKKIMKVNLRNVNNVSDIRDLISPLDIPTIAWALACAKYPDGYAYNRTVLGNDGKATSVIGTIDLQDTEVVLNSRFSKRQLQFLDAACGNTLSTEEEIRAYQNDWKEPEEQDVRVLVNERKDVVQGFNVTKKTHLVLTEGNVINFFAHGSAWDGYLADAINEVMASGATDAQKQNFLANKIETTELRDYSHFIKAVEVETVYEDGRTVNSSIDDRDSILEFLDLATNSVAMYQDVESSIRNSIVKAIRSFVNKRIKVVYGTPTYSELEDQRFASEVTESEIVPIDTVSVFFITTARTYRSLAG